MSEPPEPPTPNPDDSAAFVLRALSVDPGGLGGVVLRAWPGPARHEWQVLAQRLSGVPQRRIGHTTEPDHLFGDVDLEASVRSGAVVRRPGLLASEPEAWLWLTTAESATDVLNGALARALRAREFGGVVVALDESLPSEPGVGQVLADRLAFVLTLPADWSWVPEDRLSRVAALVRGGSKGADLGAERARVSAARRLLPSVKVPPDLERALVDSAEHLGVHSFQTVVFTHRASRVAAALAGRGEVNEEDLVRAVAVTLVPRATLLPLHDEHPQSRPDEPRPPPTEPDAAAPRADSDPPSPGDETDTDPSSVGRLADRVVAAAQVSLPMGALEEAMARSGPTRTRGSARSRDRDRQRGGGRGPTVRVLPGTPGRGVAPHILATVMAAAPWQRARGWDGTRLRIQPEDLRIRIRSRPTPETTVLLLDASGSQAAARLAEAKGAVQQILSDSYRRRDEVALVTFRGEGATEVLPPTRSLARARRVLVGLPGGGGTPLASAVSTGLQVAARCVAGGRRPRLVVLTDGSPNVGLSGAPGREGARADALRLARVVAGQQVAALVLDTSRRGSAFAREFAATMDARYERLPRPTAAALSGVVAAARRDSA